MIDKFLKRRHKTHTFLQSRLLHLVAQGLLQLALVGFAERFEHALVDLGWLAAIQRGHVGGILEGEASSDCKGKCKIQLTVYYYERKVMLYELCMRSEATISSWQV